MSNSIKLHLKDHCIECAAKKELKRLMDIYFDSEDMKLNKLEDKIEIVSKFLQENDFLKLRTSDKRLSGDIEADIVISMDKEKKLKLNIP